MALGLPSALSEGRVTFRIGRLAIGQRDTFARVGPSEQEQWLCVSETGRIRFPKKSARRWTRSPAGMTMQYRSPSDVARLG
jgi:hypothetical protein